MLSSFFKANKHHMLPSAVQGAPQKITYQSGGKESTSGGFFSFYHHFPALICHSGQIHQGNSLPEFLCCSGPLSPPLSCLPPQHAAITGEGTTGVIRQELGVSSQSMDLELGLKETSHDLGEVTLFSSPLERST